MSAAVVLMEGGGDWAAAVMENEEIWITHAALLCTGFFFGIMYSPV